MQHELELYMYLRFRTFALKKSFERNKIQKISVRKKKKKNKRGRRKKKRNVSRSLSTIISKSEFRFIILSPWIYITKFAIYKIRVAPPTNEQGRRNKFDHFKVAVLLYTAYALSPGTFIRKFILLSTRGEGESKRVEGQHAPRAIIWE